MKWCVFLILASFVIFVAADDIKSNKVVARRVASILDQVPEKERKEFLRYHLWKGYELVKKHEVGKYPDFKVDIEEEDSTLLYAHFAANNLVTDKEVLKMATTIICWENKCIDFSDPGIHPEY